VSKDTISISQVTEKAAVLTEMVQPAECLMDRYATYHLRMWLISDRLRIAAVSICRVSRGGLLLRDAWRRGTCAVMPVRACTGLPVGSAARDCGADAARVAQQIDEGTRLSRKGNSYDQRG
jgi:hypothetical protein